MRPSVLLPLVLSACATTPEGPTGQGGATFREVQVSASAAPIEALYAVCWPADALPKQRVTLQLDPGGGVMFEAKDGASNSTARCLREIVATWPWSGKPAAPIEVAPPPGPPGGFAALAWVKLLSPARYGPERGLTDPAPLVRACLERGGGVRDAARFEVTHAPAYAVKVPGGAMTDAERCIEAVLGSTAWPSTREFALDFQSSAGAPAAAGDVSAYLTPKQPASAPLDPMRVSEAIKLQQQSVAQCWEQALARRAGLGGGRTFRFRTDDTGALTAIWVAGNASEAPTAADYLLDQCLLHVLQRTRIAGGGAGEGLYTWVFAAR